MLSDEVKTRIAERIVRGPFGQHLGMSAEIIEPDRVTVRLFGAPHIMNAGDIVHGGATAALIDTAATAAAWATDQASAGTRGTTVGFALNFLAPGRGGSDLVADARVIQRGGNLTILDVVVRDDAGSQIAKAQVTYKLGLRR